MCTHSLQTGKYDDNKSNTSRIHYIKNEKMNLSKSFLVLLLRQSVGFNLDLVPLRLRFDIL